MMREIATRYGRNPGGYLWAFLEPMAFIFVMSTAMGAFGRMPAEGESFALFYSTGYLAYSFFKSMESYLSSAISANKNLLAYPIVAPFDAIMGRFVLQAATSLVVTTMILSAEIWSLRNSISLNWIPILSAILFAWFLAAGLALFNIVMFETFPLYQKFFGIVTRPLVLLSGVFHLPTGMPEPMQGWLLTNPITHIIILFREGFYTGPYSDGLDLPFLTTCSAASFFIGFTFFYLWKGARARR